MEATRREIHPPTPEPTKITGDLVIRRSMRKMVSAVHRLTVPAAKSPVVVGVVVWCWEWWWGERGVGVRCTSASYMYGHT